MCDYCRKLWTLHIDFKKTGKFLCINRYYAFLNEKVNKYVLLNIPYALIKKKIFLFY